MNTVGSVGRALADALTAKQPAPKWCVYVSIPTAEPPVRESKPFDTREDADAYAAGLRLDGRIGSHTIAGVTVAPKSERPDWRERKPKSRVLHHAERHPSCTFPPAKVRASSTRWAGERSGARDERITAGMRAWDK